MFLGDCLVSCPGLGTEAQGEGDSRRLLDTSSGAVEKAHHLGCNLRVDENRQHSHEHDGYDNTGDPGCSYVKCLPLRLGRP